MDNICRICLIKLEPTETFHIFYELQANWTILQALIDFADIQIYNDDKLPQYVCKICKDKLSEFLEFQNTIIKSDKHLKELDLNVPLVGDLETKIEHVEIEESCLSNETRSKEKNILNKHVCLVCCKEFSTDWALKIHVRTHKYEKTSLETKYMKLTKKECIEISNEAEIHACPICKKEFLMKESLEIHSITHTERKDFECDLCSKHFKSSALYAKHKKVHDKAREPICKTCGKVFTQLSHLTVHMRSHTGERPFMCHICSKTFGDSGGLLKHSFVHNPQKKVICPVCGLAISPLRIKIHIKRHSQEKKYVCEVCGQKFTANASLKRHMNIHEGVKPFECKICGKSFSQTSILMRHSRIHTGEKPFSCPVCSESFAYKQNLQSHVKRHHPDFEEKTVCDVSNS